MDIEEMKRKLVEAGVNLGQGWQQKEGKTVRSPILEKQRENLEKLEGFLGEQIEQDKKQMAELHATLTRLKHGGSR